MIQNSDGENSGSDDEEEKAVHSSLKLTTLWNQSFTIDTTGKSIEQVDKDIRAALLNDVPWPPATSTPPLLADVSRYCILLSDANDKVVYNSLDVSSPWDMWIYNYESISGVDLSIEIKVNAEVANKPKSYHGRASIDDQCLQMPEAEDHDQKSSQD